MHNREVLEVEQGIWISERRIREAKLGTRLQVVVRPGEIRILPMPADPETEPSARGWDAFRSLGRSAEPGRLSDAAAAHDRYLYGKDQ